MLIFKITDPELNVFMGRLFKEGVFDIFEVRGLEVGAFTNFQISGALDRAFDEAPETSPGYCSWERIKPFAVAFIKGKKRPKAIKITLAYPSEDAAQVHPNAAALFLNINYENNEAQLSTAVSQRNFSLDKSVDGAWDDYIDAFFAKNNIPVSTRL
ncbi:MAG: DUF5721 family protein [Defluviitaleaceae bacterium]|nr:DUF5721 family protein [Defluviitaleaceae bacterium]